MKAMFAGSFNPPTTGHLDIIKTAASMFDEVVVCVMANPEKTYKLSPEQRRDMLSKCTEQLENVSCQVGFGLTAEYALQNGCHVLVRGVRNVSDLEFELQCADINRHLCGIETVFIPTKPEYSYISSSVVRDILHNKGDISGMVPFEIKEEIMALLS